MTSAVAGSNTSFLKLAGMEKRGTGRRESHVNQATDLTSGEKNSDVASYLFPGASMGGL